MKRSEFEIGRINDTVRMSSRKLTRELEDVIKLVERSTATAKSKTSVLKGLAEVLESMRRVGELKEVEVPSSTPSRAERLRDQRSQKNQERLSRRGSKDTRDTDSKTEPPDRTRVREETEQGIEQDE